MNTNTALKIEVQFPCKHEMEDALGQMRAWAHANEDRHGFTYSTMGPTAAHYWVSAEADFRARLGHWRAKGVSFRAIVDSAEESFGARARSAAPRTAPPLNPRQATLLRPRREPRVGRRALQTRESWLRIHCTSHSEVTWI